jgi:hypothetical protein
VVGALLGHASASGVVASVWPAQHQTAGMDEQRSYGRDQIAELERKVRAIPGVSDVQNLLHLPGTPAPHDSPSGPARA